MSINAASAGIDMKDFRRQLNKSINTTGSRTLVNHFRTNAFDSFARFDRGVQKVYAEKLELQYFFYEGGLVNDSREFCISKNGKVYSSKEAKEWINEPWIRDNLAKWGVYDPLTDMGLWNCRHHPSFISKELAFELRPELKQIDGTD
jgi:hypothetical protein